MPPPPGFGALADHHFDRIGAAHIVRIEAITRRQALIHQRLRRLTFFRRHAAVAGGGRGADFRRRASQGFLDVGRERAEAHAGDGDRDLEFDRLLGEAGAEDGFGAAFFAVALQRIARQRSAEKHQIIEAGQLALGAHAADLIEAVGRGVADVIDGLAVVAEGFFPLYRFFRHGQYS